MTRRPRGPGAVVAALLAALLLPGCASLFGSPGIGSDGLASYDYELRSLLRRGAPDSALALLAPERSEAGDELLRLQQEALVAHYAGDYRRSAAAVDSAYGLAEDRYTKSVTKALLSVLTGDRILPYDPPAPERLLLHYYGALDYLRVGEPDEAAVEARRLTHELDRVEADDPSEVTPELLATLWHFASGVFEAAGAGNDAAVARRRAAAARPSRAPSSPAERSPYFPSPAPRRTDDRVPADDGAGADGGAPSVAGAATSNPATGATGDVLLIVERGFVARRVQADLTVLLLPGEVDRIRALEDHDPDELRESDLAVVRRIADRTFEGGRAVTGWSWFGRSRGDDPVLFRIAWPEYRDPPPLPGPSTLVAGEQRASPVLVADLSAAVEAAYRDRRVADLAKALLRAAVREKLADAIEEEVSKKDETLGEVAGWVARAGGALLERADTRSWSLLPQRLELFRLELPAGRHELTALLPVASGSGHDRLDLGSVEVRPGRTTVVSAREWR